VLRHRADPAIARRASRVAGLNSEAVTGADSPLTELVETVAPAVAAVRRRASEIVVGIALVVTGLAGLGLTGAAVDDATINADRGTATAEVIDASFSRTLIRFTVEGGQAVVPERGVQYPRGLKTGDTVAVEYAVSDPEQVRVAGRSVVDGIGPMLLGVAGVWAVLGPVAVWLRRRRVVPIDAAAEHGEDPQVG
jgi:hypothetical protein